MLQSSNKSIFTTKLLFLGKVKDVTATDKCTSQPNESPFEIPFTNFGCTLYKCERSKFHKYISYIKIYKITSDSLRGKLHLNDLGEKTPLRNLIKYSASQIFGTRPERNTALCFLKDRSSTDARLILYKWVHGGNLMRNKIKPSESKSHCTHPSIGAQQSCRLKRATAVNTNDLLYISLSYIFNFYLYV